ncbi:MAG: CTP-dependent riboflavin kinase [Nanoarchaeota archaeon]|nr:CTP-dependent riboflavin kinase [Nanoarchaeota archaeon]
MKRDLLLYLAKRGLFEEINSTTASVSKALKTSQQTVSRWLRILADQGLIELETTNTGFSTTLTPKAIGSLQDGLAELKDILQPKTEVKGKVVSGVGEGRYYVERYMDRLEKAFGFKPYPGTLNLKIDMPRLRMFCMNERMVRVQGFKKEGREFGALDGMHAQLGNVKGAILFPKRTSHPEDIIEFIAPNNLRRQLKLKDNSEVKLR